MSQSNIPNDEMPQKGMGANTKKMLKGFIDSIQPKRRSNKMDMPPLPSTGEDEYENPPEEDDFFSPRKESRTERKIRDLWEQLKKQIIDVPPSDPTKPSKPPKESPPEPFDKTKHP